MNRAESTRRLLDSLESDWNLDHRDKLFAMLWALYEHLGKLEFFDISKRLYDMVLFHRYLDSAIGERLKYHLFPEIRFRLQEMEESKAAGTPLTQLHPKIMAVAVERFSAGHLADAVEAAFKEVNAVVKGIVFSRLKQEFDGAKLMERAFSVERPVIKLADLSTDSGRSEQLGYMKIFAGAMTGIRNPNAHANLDMDPVEAIHLLTLASLLMRKVDSRIEPQLDTSQNPGVAAES